VTGTGMLRVAAPPGAVPVAAALSTVDGVGPAGAVSEVAVDASGAGADAGSTAATLTLYHAVRRVFDYCDPAACAALLDRVHGEFERHAGRFFGDVLVGAFQVGLPAMPTWSATFAAEFADRRGYPLTGAWLGALFGGTDDEQARIRYDHQRTRAELADEAFFVRLQRWHRRHGLICGSDQQHPARAGEPIGSTELYADYPRVGSRYGAPGSDHWGPSPRTWVTPRRPPGCSPGSAAQACSARSGCSEPRHGAEDTRTTGRGTGSTLRGERA
jgi:hypothetical protein